MPHLEDHIDCYHANTNNAYCINDDCLEHNTFLLEGPGWWGNGHKQGDAHCPECGHGKYIRLDKNLIGHPLIIAAQMVVDNHV